MTSFKFSLSAFIVGLIIGSVYIYFKNPEKKEQVKFPTPYNVGKVTYRDSKDADTCFQYRAEKVECSSQNKKIIKEQPIVVD